MRARVIINGNSEYQICAKTRELFSIPKYKRDWKTERKRGIKKCHLLIMKY